MSWLYGMLMNSNNQFHMPLNFGVSASPFRGALHIFCLCPRGAAVPKHNFARILKSKSSHSLRRIAKQLRLESRLRQREAHEITRQGDHIPAAAAGAAKRNDVGASVLPRKEADHGTDLHGTTPAAWADAAQDLFDISPKAHHIHALSVKSQPIAAPFRADFRCIL